MKKIKSRKWRNRRCNFFRGILSVVLVLVVFYCSSYVDAGMNDSVIDKVRVDDVYAIATEEGKERIIYLDMYKMNDRVAYCVDLGGDITTDIYHSTNDFTASYLTVEQTDYIRAVSYFGYGYEGHDDYKYYMASQEIIWEYLGDVEIRWSSEMKVDGEEIDIATYKNEILELIELSRDGLDFEWEDGQAYTVGDSIVIEDSSGELSRYEVLSSKYSTVSIEDNSLVIEVGNEIGTEVIELGKKGYYDYDSTFYYYDTSKRLISNGNYGGVDEVVSFDVDGASVNVQVKELDRGFTVVSVEATLEGAEYEVRDRNDKLIGTYVSDKNGKFTIDNLLLGSYYIKQIKASEGYLLNEEVVEVVVDKGSKNVTLEQQLISNVYVINKVYGSDGNYRPEMYVTFVVYDSNGKFYSYVLTDRDGTRRFRLPYGRYTVSQLDTKEGYSKVDDFVIDVREQVDEYIYYNLVNELIQTKVKVSSMVSLGEEQLRLEGFSYKIRKKNESTYLDYKGETVFEADGNGEVLIPINLSYGEYVIEQEGVPEGVLLNDDGLEFSIDDNSNLELVGSNLITEVNFSNELVMGRVKVKALGEVYYKSNNEYIYKMEKRNGVQYRLIADKDIIRNGQVIYVEGQEVYSGKNLKDGSLVIDNLYLGNYCLIDMETSEEKCFELRSIDERTKVVEESLEFIKYLDKRDIVIKNISSVGDNVGGSIFEVVDALGEVVYLGATNDEGIIKVNNMVVDDYCIRQKKVSSLYEKNQNEICFLLNEDKEVQVINNAIVKEVVSVPNTLSNDMGLYEVVVILFLIGTGILVYKKIFASKLYR